MSAIKQISLRVSGSVKEVAYNYTPKSKDGGSSP